MEVIFLNNPDFQRAVYYVQYHVVTNKISSKMT